MPGSKNQINAGGPLLPKEIEKLVRIYALPYTCLENKINGHCRCITMLLR
jgi:hypothetical protein